jgi:hypothetical protein
VKTIGVGARLLDAQKPALLRIEGQAELAAAMTDHARGKFDVLFPSGEHPSRFLHEPGFADPLLPDDQRMPPALKIPHELIKLFGPPEERNILAEILKAG